MKTITISLALYLVTQYAVAQLKIDSSEDLKNWLPETILEFKAETESYSAELAQDNTAYRVAAKKYAKGDLILSIVIFDYKEPSEKIKKATDAWEQNKRIDDPAIYSASSMIAGCKAQELIDKNKKTSQLYLYFADRYLITLSLTIEDSSLLKTVAENLHPMNLPQ